MIPCPAASSDRRIERRLHGEANFGFNFTCEMTDKNKAVIKGEITYHDTGTSVVDGLPFTADPAARVVDPVFITATGVRGGRRDLAWMRPSSRARTGPRRRV